MTYVPRSSKNLKDLQDRIGKEKVMNEKSNLKNSHVDIHKKNEDNITNNHDDGMDYDYLCSSQGISRYC